jgi:hypothetical protein
MVGRMILIAKKFIHPYVNFQRWSIPSKVGVQDGASDKMEFHSEADVCWWLRLRLEGFLRTSHDIVSSH